MRFRFDLVMLELHVRMFACQSPPEARNALLSNSPIPPWPLKALHPRRKDRRGRKNAEILKCRQIHVVHSLNMKDQTKD